MGPIFAHAFALDEICAAFFTVMTVRCRIIIVIGPVDPAEPIQTVADLAVAALFGKLRHSGAVCAIPASG